jgi:hypothetical protein
VNARITGAKKADAAHLVAVGLDHQMVAPAGGFDFHTRAVAGSIPFIAGIDGGVVRGQGWQAAAVDIIASLILAGKMDDRINSIRVRFLDCGLQGTVLQQ